jgi:hypothetical protein
VTIAPRLVILRCCSVSTASGRSPAANLGTLAEVPPFKLMSMEALGDDLLTTFLARRI